MTLPPRERPARGAARSTTMTKHWSGTGTKEDPWRLKTPPLTADYTLYRDDTANPPLLEALGLAELEHNPRNNRMRAR